MENQELIDSLTEIKETAQQLHSQSIALINQQQEQVNELIDFIEMIEALTKDKDTASRIRTFLTEKNIWK